MPKKMRINILLFRPSPGGGDRVISIYARYLRDQGHCVTITALPAHKPSLMERAKLFLRSTAPRRDDTPLVHYEHVGLDINYAAADAISTKDLPDADILIATYWITAEWALNIAPSKGAKTYFIQGFEAQFPHTPTLRVEATYRAPMKKIVISKWLNQIMRTKFNVEPIACIANSVDTKLFHAPIRSKHKAPCIGFLYGDSPNKGIDITTKAIDKIRQTIPDLKVVSFGASPVSAQLPLPQNCEFQFKPLQEKIRDVYAQCDVWICASRLEGFGLPMLEAMACRCPVTTTDVGAAQDLIENGRQGYIVPIDDSDALAEKTLSILEASDSDWRRMSDAAYKTATQYSWNDAGALFEKALYEIANEAWGDETGKELND